MESAWFGIVVTLVVAGLIIGGVVWLVQDAARRGTARALEEHDRRRDDDGRR